MATIFCTADDITSRLILGEQEVDAALGNINLNNLIDDAASVMASKLADRYTDLLADGLLKQINICLVIKVILPLLRIDELKLAIFDMSIKSAEKDLADLVSGETSLPATAYTALANTAGSINTGWATLDTSERYI